VYADTAKFMEVVLSFTGQTAPTNVPTSAALEPGRQHQSTVALATATAPGPSAPGLVSQLTLSPPLSLDNPVPCVLNKAPDPRSLATSSSASTLAEEVEVEDAEDVEMENGRGGGHQRGKVLSTAIAAAWGELGRWRAEAADVVPAGSFHP
jgi:hypothetical protein